MTGKERRQQLLDVGRHLFAERGLDGISVEEIAAQAGVSKPVVYEHFGSKEGLYAVVVDREMDRFLTMANRLLAGEDTRAKFEAAAIGLLRYIEENTDGFRILVRDSPPAGSGSGTFGSMIADIAGQVEYTLRDVLAARGYDPRHAPMYAQMLVGMVTFTGQWWLDARKPKLRRSPRTWSTWPGTACTSWRSNRASRPRWRRVSGPGQPRRPGGTPARCRRAAAGRRPGPRHRTRPGTPPPEPDPARPAPGAARCPCTSRRPGRRRAARAGT
jgi:AcrR family transcriptional regulator